MAAPATTPQPLLQGDGRRTPRKAVADAGLITVEMCPAGFGLMLNIGEKGIAVYTLKNLSSGQAVQVSFLIPGSSTRVECGGEVVWAMDSHAGLRFTRIEERSASKLQTWMASLPATATPTNPRSLRREFPVRDEQVRTIRARLVDEQLNLEQGLHFVLNRLLHLTGAEGGAIALGTPEEMVCRASEGVAPEVGVQISSTSGITGECIRTAAVIYCEDTEVDPRVDRDACRELNLRSSLIVPVLHQLKVAGVVELFSSSPSAFGEDHRWLVTQIAQTIAQLAHGAVKNTAKTDVPKASPRVDLQKGAASPKRAPVATDEKISAAPRKPAPQVVEQSTSQAHAPAPARDGSVKRLAVAASLATTIICLLLLFGRHTAKTASHVQAATALAVQSSLVPAATPAPERDDVSVVKRATHLRAVNSAMKFRSEAEPTDGLAADNVIVLPHATANVPSSSPSTEPAPSISLAPEPNLQAVVVPSVTNEPTLLRTASLTGGKTIRRIEPHYPSLALQRRIQGDVVLRAHISKEGKVVDIRQVKGDPILGAAARAAVRQWRYEPFRRDNVPQEMDTTITLQFRLSQGY